MIGSRLGSYDLLEELGAGGMGTVYKAHQQTLDRIVAVKVLLPQFASDDVFVERFLREARAIATLDHPGIVTVYDVGESEGIYYFAMQFLSGRTLEQALADNRPLAPEQAQTITRHVAEALGHAHAAGILHRDVKPGNIFLTDDGRVVLTDFGIAWAASQTRLTMVNTSIGSPGYMAPEQVEGKPFDQRTDLYSLGIVLHEMLTGQLPYQGDSAVSVAYQHVQAPVPSPRSQNPAVSEEIDTITRRLVAKSPDERYFAAGDLIQELDRLGYGQAPVPGSTPASGRNRTLGVAITATGVALAIVGTLLFAGDWWRRPPAQAGGSGAPAAVTTQPSGTSDPQPPEEAVVEQTTDKVTTDPGVQAAASGEPPSQTPPMVEPTETFRITSQPQGATVLVNGSELESLTPASMDLEAGTTYELTLRLNGHEPAGWSFTLDDLNRSQLESGELHFPLSRSTPPAMLSVAMTFPVQLRIGGKTYQSPITDLAIEPGSYEVQIKAPSVFYSDSRRIDLVGGASETLDLPAVTSIAVAATPSRCRVRIDGRDAGYVPMRLEITVGSHEFQFDWESIGQVLTLTRVVTRQTERIFAAAPKS